MKKKNILGLGLGLLIITSPINPIEKNYQNIAFAEELQENTESETITLEDFQKEISEFKISKIYQGLDEENKKEFDKLVMNLSEESFNQEAYDKITGKILSFTLTDKDKSFKPLYDEVKSMVKENLSDELKSEFNEIKESYESEESFTSIEEYDQSYEKLSLLKEKINAYNKELDYKKKLLKEGIEKNSSLDLSNEKKILDDEKSNIKAIDDSIESVNKKVAIFNEKQKKEAREKLSKQIDEAIKKHDEVKKDLAYKKSSKKAKDSLDNAFKELQNSQKALKEGKDGDYKKVLDKYNELIRNLDGNKFIDDLNSLIEYFNNNKDKIKDEEVKAKLAKELNSVISDDSFDKEKLADLDKRIKDAVNATKEKNGSLKPVKVDGNDDKENKTKKVAVSKAKNPVKKKSRSFVRTGVTSIAVVVGVLAVAAGGYIYLKKKK